LSLEDSASICFVVRGAVAPSFENQTVRDYQVLRNVDEHEALRRTITENFLWLSGASGLRPQAAEECIWALRSAEWVTWRDTGEAPPPSLRECAGPLGVVRRVLEVPEEQRSGTVHRLPWACRESEGKANFVQSAGAGPFAAVPEAPLDRADPHRQGNMVRSLARISLHLRNAGLLSWDCWSHDPLGTAARLIPLRWKQDINDRAGRAVFDLTFYLRFHPGAAVAGGKLLRRVWYKAAPRSAARRRVCFCVRDLGHHAVESRLEELALQLDPASHELFLLATGAFTKRSQREWEDRVDWVYPVEEMAGGTVAAEFLYSFLQNWQMDALVIDGEAAAYRVLPALKSCMPGLRVLDFVPLAERDWELFSASLDVDEQLATRVVTSQKQQRHLHDMGVSAEKIRLILPGVDLSSLAESQRDGASLRRDLGLPESTYIILCSAALDLESGVFLLPEVAEQLDRMTPARALHLVIAGQGDEEGRLRQLIDSRKLTNRFSVLAKGAALAALLPEATLLVVPSERLAVPPEVVLALAAETPVVACAGGPLAEAVPPECGILVEGGSLLEMRLAEAIHALLGDPARRESMGRAGRELVERSYSLPRAQKEYQRVIDELTPPVR
jgi:glycosyltransferase involved in cell wall biosynthesis